jgi:hypothetical protein
MPARQSFEQSQLASQIGVGYGEAQVLPDRAALIEQQAARKEREGVKAAEAAKKAEKEKQAALKIDFPKDLTPAMQSALAREATKMYEELLTYYGTEGFDQKKQEKLSEFTGKIAQAKEYTRQFKSGVDTYAKDRGTKNYNPDTDTDINLVMDSNIGDASWDDVSGWMDKANTDLSTSYTTKGYAGLAKEIMPIVNFSADKNTVMFPGKDGKTYTRTTEEFSEDDAKNLIRQTISTSDTPNDWLQSGLAEMSDADKKTYGEDINGIADYYADRFASDFTRDNIKTTYKEPKKGKAKAIDEVVLTMNDGASNTNYKVGDGVVKSKVSFANQQALTPLKGEKDDVAITVGNYYDVDAGEWIDETSKYMVTPTTIQDYVIWNGEEPLNIEIEGKEIELGKGVYLPEEYVQKLTPKEKENTSWQTAIEGVIKKGDGTFSTIRIPQTKVNQSAYTTIAQQRKIYDKYMGERSGSVREEEEPKEQEVSKEEVSKEEALRLKNKYL